MKEILLIFAFAFASPIQARAAESWKDSMVTWSKIWHKSFSTDKTISAQGREEEEQQYNDRTAFYTNVTYEQRRTRLVSYIKHIIAEKESDLSSEIYGKIISWIRDWHSAYIQYPMASESPTEAMIRANESFIVYQYPDELESIKIEEAENGSIRVRHLQISELSKIDKTFSDCGENVIISTDKDGITTGTVHDVSNVLFVYISDVDTENETYHGMRLFAEIPVHKDIERELFLMDSNDPSTQFIPYAFCSDAGKGELISKLKVPFNNAYKFPTDDGWFIELPIIELAGSNKRYSGEYFLRKDELVLFDYNEIPYDKNEKPTATLNTDTGKMIVPNCKLGKDNYSAVLTSAGDQIFKIVSEKKSNTENQ